MSMRQGQVVNCHWYKGVENLPPNTVYIGRGNNSPYGNPFSSQDGENSKEECVALHRVDLYQNLVKTPSLLHQITHDLGGKDLACWCKQKSHFTVCHGDNYLHVLHPDKLSRDYGKTVAQWVLDDLKIALHTLETVFLKTVTQTEFMPFYITLGDLRIEINALFIEAREKEFDAYRVTVLMALVTVDLESALQETRLEVVDYRLLHAIWVICHYALKTATKEAEPRHPQSHLKTKKKISVG